MRVSLEKVIEELQFLSNRISEQTRTISLSVLALDWLFLIGGKDAPILPTAPNKTLFVLSGAAVIASLVVDYLQYIFGYFDSDRIRRQAESQDRKTAEYDYSGFLYWGRKVAFWIKQVLALIGVGLLAAAIIGAF